MKNLQKPLKLYNTATREKQEFKPLVPNQVKLYTCGPTVYHFVHIGNFRTFIFEDLLRRTLKFFGFSLTHVMNLTDVDDKTIKGALANKISLDAFTKPYKEAFFADLDTLNIERAEFYPAATDYIEQMIEMIEVLLKKEIAYVGTDRSIYFSIRKFPRYGCLSHLNLDQLKTGASERVASDEYEKEQAVDFVLWKHHDPLRDGEIYWDSPFGPGRPGWHLECSCMAMQILGETIDIHVGGIDNLFPHHENEVAQSEAYSEKLFSQFWMHAEHLIVEGKKMSKSLGNFYTLRDLLNQGFTGKQIRYLLLQTHYKTPLNFTFQGLTAAKNSLQRLQDFIERLKNISTEESSKGLAKQAIEQMLEEFTAALADDLNISLALAALFDFVREMNAFCDREEINVEDANLALEALKKVDTILGILSFNECDEEVPLIVKEAFENRLQARKEKKWLLADELRAFIDAKGYLIEDGLQGARLKKKGE